MNSCSFHSSLTLDTNSYNDLIITHLNQYFRHCLTLRCLHHRIWIILASCPATTNTIIRWQHVTYYHIIEFISSLHFNLRTTRMQYTFYSIDYTNPLGYLLRIHIFSRELSHSPMCGLQKPPLTTRSNKKYESIQTQR